MQTEAKGPKLSPVWDGFHRLPAEENGSVVIVNRRIQYRRYKNDNHHYAAWCKAEVDVLVAGDVERENAQRDEGFPVPFLTQDERRLAVLRRTIDTMPLCGKVDDLKEHLRSCHIINASESLREKRDAFLAAQHAFEAERAAKATARAAGSAPQPSMAPPPIIPYNPSSPNPFYVPPSLPSHRSASPSPSPSPSPRLPFQSLPTSLRGSSMPPSPIDYLQHLPTLSRSESPVPSLKRRQTSSGGSYVVPHAPLSAEMQKEFNADLCDLFAANNWAWRTANTPQTRFFFGKWMPSAQLPDRRHLSGAVLDLRAEQVVESICKEINGKMASYAIDGWKNNAKTNLDSSVLSVETKAYLLQTHNMTGRPKTGDELFKIIRGDIKLARERFNVEVIAVLTDDGPDGKKARRLIFQSMPHIVVFYCWAHQAHLITGNVLAVKEPFMDAPGEALEIIKFIVNHSFPYDLLRNQQLQHNETPLTLFLPGATRWGSNYNSIRRVLRLRIHIKTIFTAWETQLIVCTGKKAAQKQAVRGIIEIVKSNDFWRDLHRVARWLEPLAIACNTLQAPNLRVDIVLMTLANLYRFGRDAPAADAALTTALHASLERRFANTDAEIMIFGVFANPLLRNRPFNRAALPPISFLHMGRRLMRRFYGKDMQGDMEFQGAIQDMLDNLGFFSDASFGLDGYRTSGNFDPSSVPDIIRLYRYMAVDLTRPVGRDAYILLAIRVLSILVNSAGPERVFSEFGVVHTKHRNRLNPQKVHKTALVRQDLHRGHLAAGRIPERKARHYSLDGCEVPDGPDSDDAPDPYGEDEESAEEESGDSEMTVGAFDLFAEPFLDGTRPEIVMDNFFAQASEVLIALADEEKSEEATAMTAEGDGDGDGSDDDELAEPTLANAAASSRRRPPAPTQSIPPSAVSRNLPKFKKIPLANLFNYPPPGTANSDLDFYWNVGRVALDKDDVELEKQQQECSSSRPEPRISPQGP